MTENTENKIIIELDSWDLLAAKVAVIRACVTAANTSGGLQQNDIGRMLGVTGSSVSSFIKQYNIEWRKPKPNDIQNAIDLLASKNYKILELPEGATGTFIQS